MQKQVIIPEDHKYISAFLTMRCNLDCKFCLNALNKNEEFNRNKFKEISGEQWINALNKIKTHPSVPITFSGGEPFLHKDFIYIINNLKPELNIDILTNLSYEKGLEEFLQSVSPNRIKREAPYASIRVSYHPEQMGNGEKLVKNIKRFQDAGFSIGVWSVLHPSQKQLSAINQMQFRCRDVGIDFRLKEFTGEYQGEIYGDYSQYNESIMQKNTKSCLCKTSELLIGPNGDVYKCHRDLFKEEFSIGNITHQDFQIKDKYNGCNNYGRCHPCDVKLKTNYKQELGHTSVKIKDIGKSDSK